MPVQESGEMAVCSSRRLSATMVAIFSRLVNTAKEAAASAF